MEIIGIIAIIFLCLLSLVFIVLGLGPIIQGEILSWKDRKNKYLKLKEDEFNFKCEMDNLKRESKKSIFMKKNNIAIDNAIYEENVLDTFSQSNDNIEEIEDESNTIEDVIFDDGVIANDNDNSEPIFEPTPIEEIIQNNENESEDVSTSINNEANVKVNVNNVSKRIRIRKSK